MKKLCFLFTILLLSSAAINTYAQQTNFQVSVPPIPWYEFSKGDKDLKVNATFLYLTGKIDDPNIGGDVTVFGGGVSGFYRYAFKDNLALDIGGQYLQAGGDIGNSATMDLTLFSLPLDFEFQLVKSNDYSVLLFAGYSFTWLNIGADFDDGTDNASADISSSMRGPQGGIQAALKYPEFVFTPFFMVTRISGDAALDLDYNGSKMSLTSGIPATTSFYYGIDIIYLPWETTLSSVIQQAMSSGDNQGFRTYILTVSYHFQPGAGDNTIDVPVNKQKQVKKPARKQSFNNIQ